MTRSMERRNSARFPAVANRLLVEWWDGAEACSTVAKLVNISRDGALLDIELPPPVCQAVWMKLVDAGAIDWALARVVRHDGPHGAGLKFSDSCPYDFYQAVVLGIGLDPKPATDPNPRQSTESRDQKAESKEHKADSRTPTRN